MFKYTQGMWKENVFYLQLRTFLLLHDRYRSWFESIFKFESWCILSTLHCLSAICGAVYALIRPGTELTRTVTSCDVTCKLLARSAVWRLPAVSRVVISWLSRALRPDCYVTCCCSGCLRHFYADPLAANSQGVGGAAAENSSAGKLGVVETPPVWEGQVRRSPGRLRLFEVYLLSPLNNAWTSGTSRWM